MNVIRNSFRFISEPHHIAPRRYRADIDISRNTFGLEWGDVHGIDLLYINHFADTVLCASIRHAWRIGSLL